MFLATNLALIPQDGPGGQPSRPADRLGMTPRDYQDDAVEQLFNLWDEDLPGTPCSDLCVAPVGCGKTIMIAMTAHRAIRERGARRVLILTHVQELVGQNYETLRRYWPAAPAGIFAAGLNRKDRATITVASVQSIARIIETWAPVDMVIVDEVHLQPADGGQYNHVKAILLQKNPALKWIGFTGTPYRLSSGSILEPYGDNKPQFTRLAFEISVSEMYIRRNLTPLVTKAPKAKVDTTGIGTKGGEFIEGELDKAFNTDEKNASIVSEIIDAGAARKKWLVFGVTIDHCTRLRNLLVDSGVTAEVVSSKTPSGERKSIIARYQRGEIKCLVNVGTLTTGFDAPEIDLVALVRATKSPGLFVQMLGRGVRLSAEKPDCLVLDFGGSTLIHGLFDRIRGVRKKKKGEPEPEVAAKECKACGTINDRAAKSCSCCGTAFVSSATPDREAKLRHTNTISKIASSPDEVMWVEIASARVAAHYKKDSKFPSLRIDYTTTTGLSVQEFIHFEHVDDLGQPTYPRKLAETWWRKRSKTRPPLTVAEAQGRLHELWATKRLLVIQEGTWWRVRDAEMQKHPGNRKV